LDPQARNFASFVEGIFKYVKQLIIFRKNITVGQKEDQKIFRKKGVTENYREPLSIQQPNRIWERRAADACCYLGLMP